ncbi:hypothetical protein MSMTP_3116 [Methanosarcina sp. MTP4]|nr:hypothetical protein MSMTP_3116 [Methanosarcina sp. MTP4]
MQGGALAVEEGLVWAEMQVAVQVRVSGADESPVSEEAEDLLPGVTTPDITIQHLLSPGPNQMSIYLRTG